MDLILTLTGGLTAALGLGLVAERLRLSPIVGYLAAGIAVGPFTPGFVAHADIAHELAELGVILLMFGVGLGFHVHELLAVRKVAVPGAIFGVLVATALGALVARAFGTDAGDAIVFGLAIAVTSTVVLLRVLSDAGTLTTRAGHVAVGWLVVEDLLTVLLLVLLPAVGTRGADVTALGIFAAVGKALLKVALLVGLSFALGKRFVPWALASIAKTKSRELFTLAVLVLALGVAVVATKVFGASTALGAFLAGMVVGQSDFSARAASEALPMRDAFAVLFFVSVGMLFDPRALAANLPLAAATLAVVLVGKPLAVLAVVRLLRYPSAMAITIAASLAQIGEFSFVIASLGRSLGRMSEASMQAIVIAAIVSITTSPFIYRGARAFARRAEGRGGPTRMAALAEEVPAAPAGFRAIVVGYGPVGQTVTRLLRENGVAPTVIELNHETVASLTRSGIRAVYGDAAQLEVLRLAGAETATSLVFAASGTVADGVVRAARTLNPQIRVLARAAYVREVSAAVRAGAEVVVTSEVEVALAMAEHLLTALGATGEQLDRERARVRESLLGASSPSA